jgi:hypothetical protein
MLDTDPTPSARKRFERNSAWSPAPSSWSRQPSAVGRQPVRRYVGTPVPRYAGTPVPRYAGAPVRRCCHLEGYHI